MNIYLVNPSHLSFGVGVITPRWLFVLAAATPREYGDPVIVDETLAQIDISKIQAGDVVGIGIHTGNALRGYEVGRKAREKGAYVIYGGIHASLYPEEALRLGEANGVVQGDGDVVWASVLADCASGNTKELYEAGKIGPEPVQGGPLGLDSPQQLHVGLGPDGARVSQALFVLLCLAHGRPEAPPACIRRGHRGDRQSPPTRIPVHCTG